MFMVQGQWPPVYVRSIEDLNMDGSLDEAVAVLRPVEGPGFSAFFYEGLGNLLPTISQSIILAPEVEPEGISIADLNDDGAPDVSMLDLNSGRRLILANNGGGQFAPVQPGDQDADGDTDLDDHVWYADCMAGPGSSPVSTGGLSEQLCLFYFDMDGDNDIDLLDGAYFNQSYTGG